MDEALKQEKERELQAAYALQREAYSASLEEVLGAFLQPGNTYLSLQGAEILRQRLPGSREPIVTALLKALQAGKRRPECLALLADSKDERIYPLLAGAMEHDDSDLRRVAVWGLRHFARPEVVQLLNGRTQDRDVSVRTMAQKTLRALQEQSQQQDMRGAQGAEACLECLRQRPGVALFREALATLRQLQRDGEAAPHLVAALADPHYHAWVIPELGRLRVAQAVPALLKLATDPKCRSRPAVVEALGNIGDRRAADTLLEVTHNDPEEWVCREALKALTKLGEERGFQSHVENLIGDEVVLAAWSRKILGDMGDPRIVDHLVHLLNQPGGSQRAAAAQGLAKLQASQALPALQAHRADPDPQVRAAVLKAIQQLQ